MLNSALKHIAAAMGGWFQILDPSIPRSLDDCNGPNSTTKRPLLRYSVNSRKSLIIAYANGTEWFAASCNIGIIVNLLWNWFLIMITFMVVSVYSICIPNQTPRKRCICILALHHDSSFPSQVCIPHGGLTQKDIPCRGSKRPSPKLPWVLNLHHKLHHKFTRSGGSTGWYKSELEQLWRCTTISVW